MEKRCNQCNALTREEAQELCRFEDCPHKQETKQVFIVLTEQDLIDSPELVDQGYKAGDHLFADNAGNTAILTPPEPHLPPGGEITKSQAIEMQNALTEQIPGIVAKVEARMNEQPAQGDPGDEQPTESKSIIGKIADFITGK